MTLSLDLADAKPHAESHSSDVTSVPWLCHDITHVPSILNQSPRACISLRPGSIAMTSARNPSIRCGWLIKHRYYIYYTALFCNCRDSCGKTTPKSDFNAVKDSHLEKLPPSWIFGRAKSKFRFLIARNLWFDTKIIQIGQLSGVLFKNVYFDTQNGGHFENGGQLDTLFFSKKVTHMEYPCQFWCLHPDLKDFPEKPQLIAAPLCIVGLRVYIYHVQAIMQVWLSVYPSYWSKGCTNPWRHVRPKGVK